MRSPRAWLPGDEIELIAFNVAKNVVQRAPFCSMSQKIALLVQRVRRRQC
jgi:hypothetical protein